MNILFLSDNFPPECNAAASRVYERAVYWARWGHQVTVIASAPNFPEGRLFPGYRNRWYHKEEMDGIRVIRVKTFITSNEGVVLRTLDFLSFMCSAVFAGLFQSRPDVVIASSPQFFSAVGGWGLAALRRRPFVFEIADLWPASTVAVGALPDGRLARMLERIELFLYRRAALVIAQTPAFKTDLVRRDIDPDKVRVILNGVDLPRYRPRRRDPVLARKLGVDGCFTVAYIGTHGMAHGLQNALQAATLLREETHLRFLFVGSGAERRQLLDYASDHGLDNVVFVARQPKASMPGYWSLSDLALVHLRDAAVFGGVIPSKIFEAMSMGVPILLAAPGGEAQRIIEETGVGRWVPPEQPVALAEEVLRLSRNPRRIERMSDQCLSVAPRYSREQQAKTMLDAVQAVLRRS